MRYYREEGDASWLEVLCPTSNHDEPWWFDATNDLGRKSSGDEDCVYCHCGHPITGVQIASGAVKSIYHGWR